MHTNYPLVLNIQHDPSSGRLVIRAEYDPDYLGRVEVRRFIRQLGHLANQCTHAGLSMSEVEFFTIADRADIWAWNPAQPPATSCYLHHMFEEMATRQPDRLAIDSCFPDLYLYRRLSYLELDKYTTRLSEYISAHTVHHARIGLCF